MNPPYHDPVLRESKLNEIIALAMARFPKSPVVVIVGTPSGPEDSAGNVGFDMHTAHNLDGPGLLTALKSVVVACQSRN